MLAFFALVIRNFPVLKFLSLWSLSHSQYSQFCCASVCLSTGIAGPRLTSCIKGAVLAPDSQTREVCGDFPSYWKAAKLSTGLVIIMTNTFTLRAGVGWLGLCLALSQWWMGQPQAVRCPALPLAPCFCCFSVFVVVVVFLEITSVERDYNSIVIGSWEIWGKESRACLFSCGPGGMKPGFHLQFFCSQPLQPWARLITRLPFVLPSSKAEGRCVLLQRGGRSQDVAQERRSVRRMWGSAFHSKACLEGGGGRGSLQ